MQQRNYRRVEKVKETEGEEKEELEVGGGGERGEERGE